MDDRRYAEVFEILAGQLPQKIRVDVILGERLRVVLEPQTP
jgi:hypothetical protein